MHWSCPHTMDPYAWGRCAFVPSQLTSYERTGGGGERGVVDGHPRMEEPPVPSDGGSSSLSVAPLNEGTSGSGSKSQHTETSSLALPATKPLWVFGRRHKKVASGARERSKKRSKRRPAWKPRVARNSK